LHKPASISYTQSRWANFLEKVAVKVKSGQSVESIASDMNLSYELIDMTIKTYINKVNKNYDNSY
jgi:hypothetical protein